MSKNKETGSSAMWNRDMTITFCVLCLREIELGNRPTTYFNKEGWQDLVLKFKESTGKEYDRMKFKNKWDQLKKDWKIWKELKRGSTGLGWDPLKRTIDAPEEWWEERIQVVPAAKKFRFNSIDPVIEEKLDSMFSGVVATGVHAVSQNQFEFVGLPDTPTMEHVSESEEPGNHVNREVESSAGSKRPRTENRKKADPIFMRDTITSLAETCKARAGFDCAPRR